MKRILSTIVLLASMALFAACEDEPRYYLPDSHWILHVDTPTEGRRLNLTFSGDQLKSSDGSYDTRPFTGTETWTYYINDNDELCITSNSYSDDDTQESHLLGYSINEAATELVIVYDPLFGSRRSYRFDRR